LAVRGCGVLSAAVLVGETAGVERFRSKDHFARFTGTAPIPVWSGASEGKVRLNRGGNRLTNTALHMIAVTQSRTEGPAGPIWKRRTDQADSPIHAAPHDAGCGLT
jgi:transposase